MKTILLAVLFIGMMSSCKKQTTGDWVHFSSYNEYVILNNGDTVTYSDGWNMQGLTSGATKHQLTPVQQESLLKYLDTICRTSTPTSPFVDKSVKWREMDSITGVKHTLEYWMKFQGHTINDKYKNLTADDVKMIVCVYHSTYQRYVVDKDNGYRLYYDIFEGE